MSDGRSFIKKAAKKSVSVFIKGKNHAKAGIDPATEKFPQKAQKSVQLWVKCFGGLFNR